MSDLDYKIAGEFKEIFQRISVLEQDIRRHEHVAGVAFSFLVLLISVLSFISWVQIKSIISEYLAKQVDVMLKPKKEEAERVIKDNRLELDALIAQVRAFRDQAVAEARDGLGAPDYEIQFGENNARFDNDAYLTMSPKFSRPFSSVPQVFVGEAQAGSWLIVKVDEKSVTGFKWAANNLLGKSQYETVIQWVAIAKIPPKKDPEVLEAPSMHVDF